MAIKSNASRGGLMDDPPGLLLNPHPIIDLAFTDLPPSYFILSNAVNGQIGRPNGSAHSPCSGKVIPSLHSKWVTNSTGTGYHQTLFFDCIFVVLWISTARIAAIHS